MLFRKPRSVFRVFYPVCMLPFLTAPICATAGLLGNNFTPYVGASSRYDSNIFRLSDGAQVPFPNQDQRWDIIVQTQVGLIADVPVERQRFTADLNVDFNQYQEYTFLDYIGSNSRVRWDWEIGDHWSGIIGYNYRRFLTSFVNFRANTFGGPVQDITDNHEPYAEFAYRFHPDWEIAGGFGYINSAHSAASRKVSDFDAYTYTGELRHRNEAGNYLGIEVTFDDVDFPNRTAAQAFQTVSSYKQYSAGATVDWQLTGKSKVKGVVGYTIVNSRPDSSRNFNQVTWRFEYQWLATAKTRIDLATWRDIRPVVDPVSSFSKDTGVSLIPVWEPTEKIELRGNFTYVNQDFSGSGTVQAVGLSQRTDDLYTIGFGLGYKPLQKVLLEVVYDYQNRSSTRAFIDYFYHSVIGNVRIEF